MPEEPNNTPNPMPDVEPASGQGMPPQQPAFAPAQPSEPSQSPMPEQSPAPTPQPVAVDPQPPKKSGKKKFVIAGVVAAVLVLLTAGGAFAYFWYQNPDKVIADSLVNTLSSTPGSLKTTASYKAGDVGVSLSVDAKGNDKLADATLTFEYASTEQKIDLKSTANMVATESGTVYLRLNNVRELARKAVDAMVESSAAQYKKFGYNLSETQIASQKKSTLAQLEPVIVKVDNKWIKFSADKKSSTGDDQKCMRDAVEKLKTDRAYRGEISKAYADNRFVVVKEELGLKDGSYGYVLDLDQEKVKAFGDAAKSTQFVKDVTKCSGSSPVPDSTNKSDNKFENKRVELWVSQWSHQITGLKVDTTYADSTQPGSLNLDVTIGYEQAGNITEPTDAIDSETLMEDIQKSMGLGVPVAPIAPASI